LREHSEIDTGADMDATPPGDVRGADLAGDDRPADAPSSDFGRVPGLDGTVDQSGGADRIEDANSIEDSAHPESGADAPSKDDRPADGPSVPDGPPTSACGNGKIDPGEQCDPPSSCPSTCASHGCTKLV